MNKIIKLLLSLMMCVSVFVGTPIFALEESETSTYVSVNPMHEDVKVEINNVSTLSLRSNTYPTFDNVRDAGEYIRNQLLDRNTSVTFELLSEDADPGEVYFNKIEPIIYEHTGNPKEGDYLLFHSGTPHIECSVTEGEIYSFVYTITPNMYTTLNEENIVDEKVNEVLNDIISESMSDYEKVSTIYDFITSLVYYDYENLPNDDYVLKYTAYAALINEISVCQGYANLLYRMLLECGIDSRIISGDSKNSQGETERHSWNIVNLDNKYYNLDATWDSQQVQNNNHYMYYLLNEADFINHTRDSRYTTEEFNEMYPMADLSYGKSDNWNNHAADSFSGGSGTESDPYLISSAEELALLSKLINNENKEYISSSYKLTNDIDLLGYNWIPINKFSGHLDGNNFSISNMSILHREFNHVGFIRWIYEGTVSNLNIINACIDHVDDVTSIYSCGIGLLAGVVEISSIQNCTIEGNVYGESLKNAIDAGLVYGVGGANTLENVYAYGNIDIKFWKSACVGGLIGLLDNTNLSQCSYIGDMNVYQKSLETGQEQSFLICMGGLVGGVYWGDSTINDCYAMSNSTIATLDGADVGSIIGHINLNDDDSVEMCNVYSNSLMNYSYKNQKFCLQNAVNHSWGNSSYVNNIGGATEGKIKMMNVGFIVHNEMRLYENIEANGNIWPKYNVFDLETKNEYELFVNEMKFSTSVWNIEDNYYPTLKGQSKIKLPNSFNHVYENYSCEYCFGYDKTVKFNGKHKDNIYWSLENGVLTISGVGSIQEGDYNEELLRSEYPWDNLPYETLIFEDEITSIPICSFWKNESLKTVILGKNINYVGNGAFSECPKLANVYVPISLKYINYIFSPILSAPVIHYAGTEEQWNNVYVDPCGEWNFKLDKVLFNCDSYDDHFDKTGHNLGDWYEILAPTCTEEGLQRRDCTSCDYYKESIIPTNEHSYSPIVTAPTCAEQGYTTWTCHCGDSYVSDYVVTLPHDYEITIIDPTCTTNGITTYQCKNCSDSYENYFNEWGHLFINYISDNNATTEQDGTKTAKCERCDATDTIIDEGSKLPKPEHKHSYTSKVTEPTCTEQGYTTYTCECGHSYVSDYVGTIPHDYEVTNVKPTCTTDGMSTYQCKNCGDNFENHFDKWGHLFTNYVSDNNATTEQDGTKTAKCERCDATDTIVDEGSKLPKPEHKHSYTSKVTAPTCTEQGYTAYTCECGDSYKDDFVKENGHNHVLDTSTVKDGTCTEQGYTGDKLCSCGDIVKGTNTSKLGHVEVVDKAVAATCTQTGLTEGKHCSRCSTVLVKQETVKALDHEFKNYVSNNDATTEQDGTKTAKCERCDETDTIVDEGSKLPKPEHKHDYTQEVTAPTCTEGGYTTYTCECGDSYIGNYVNTLGHDMGNWMMISMPTCTKDGLERRNCTRCNYYEERNIQAEHGYTAKVIAPTCTEQGYTIWTCHCGDTYKDNYTNALYHEFKTYLSNNDATTEQDGTKTAKCERCNETNTIPDVGSKLPSQEEPNPEQPTKPVVNGANRVFGASRYETAFKVADTLKSTLGVDKFDAVIVANGTNFADALAGSYLSAKKNAPILMTDKKNANITNLVNYIKSNLRDGGVVYILGGSAAVSSDLDKQLYSNYYVKRLAGNDRYGTNLEILKEAGVTTEDLLVCTGTNFADSLSASATGRPMLLVGKKLNQDQIHFLNSLSGNKIIVVGGTGAVNGAIETSLRAYGEVSRLAGASRYKTSVMVAETFFSNPTSAVVAYGRNFPDGLSGGALAYTLQAPLLLAENKEASVIAEYTNRNGIKDGYVLGGSGLISEASKQMILNK